MNTRAARGGKEAMVRRHFFKTRVLAERVRRALGGAAAGCSRIERTVRASASHCCPDDCCGQSPCVWARSGFQFSSPFTQRKVHVVALAQGGSHVFLPGRRSCRFCKEPQPAAVAPQR